MKSKIVGCGRGRARSAQTRLLRDFLDAVPDGIYLKNLMGRFEFVNQAYAQSLGLAPEQVMGKTACALFPKDYTHPFISEELVVLKKGKPVLDKRERVVAPNGSVRCVACSWIPHRDSRGKSVGLIGIVRDMTRLDRMEQSRETRFRREAKLESREELNRLKAEFVATVSHELRTPLTIIKQIFSLFYDESVGPLNSKQRELLAKMKRHIDRLKALLDQLLEMPLFERKQLRLHYSLVNLNDIFKDSMAFFKQAAREKHVHLTYHLPPQGVNLFVDAERVAQVISNLMNNALKFTPENGRVLIEVKVLDTKVRVGVIDTGVGIAKPDLPKVFEKFVQVGGHPQGEKKGLGLGLSIVRELVEVHGGEVWAESQPGVGSKFYFTLPSIFASRLLGKSTKSRIQKILQKKKRVFLINLLIMNYQEFITRFQVERKKITRDIEGLIQAGYQKFFSSTGKQSPILIKGLRQGKYGMLIADAGEEAIKGFCDEMRTAIKEYFVRHKIEDVFIALGMRAYPAFRAGDELSNDKEAAANLQTKEIYIGSEMRQARRINYHARMKILSPQEFRQAAETVDISSRGCCFLSKKSLPTDAKIKICIELIKTGKELTVAGCVRWVKTGQPVPAALQGPQLMGVEFLSLKDKEKRALEKELEFYNG